MHFTKYTDHKKEWRWRLVGDNGRTLADSGEGYLQEASCNHAIKLIRAGAATCEVRRLDNTVRQGWIKDPSFAQPQVGSFLSQALREQYRRP